jgi:uncharacterized protein YbcI
MIRTAVLYVGKGRSKVEIDVQEDWEQGEDYEDMTPAGKIYWTTGEMYVSYSYVSVFTKDKSLRPKIEEIFGAEHDKFYDNVSVHGKTVAEVVAILAEKL